MFLRLNWTDAFIQISLLKPDQKCYFPVRLSTCRSRVSRMGSVSDIDRCAELVPDEPVFFCDVIVTLVVVPSRVRPFFPIVFFAGFYRQADSHY